MHTLIRAAMIGFAWAGTAAAQPASAPVRAADGAARLFERSTALRSPLSTVAVGRAVVSAADPRAAAAGAEMLSKGGSAVDAALATAFALTVVEPQSSGLGGGAFLVMSDAHGRVRSWDGRETAPASATPERFLTPDGKPMDFRSAVLSGRSVGVPGLVALAAKAHAAGGRLPWATLFAPAIRLARGGVRLSPRLVHTLGIVGPMLEQGIAGERGAARLYVQPGGAARPVGTLVLQPELAATFETIARGGRDAFYKGPIAERIATTVSTDPRGGGGMTTADLAGYDAIERQPVCGTYRGWRLCGAAPPASGAVAVLQILRQLERFDMGKLGPHNPLSWHLFAESQRLALADRDAWEGDPGFTAVPVDGLLDPAYIARRSALIRIDRAMADAPPGLPPGAPLGASAIAEHPEKGTSSVAAADADGTMVAITSTIESIFGSGEVANGFFLNNQLTDFDFTPNKGGRPAPNRVEAGKRPRSSMAPMLLFAPDGRAVGAIGAAGGATIIAQVAKTAIAIIDWRMSIEDAIAAPVVFAPGKRFAFERGTRLDAMAATFKALGHDATASDLPLKTNGIVRTPAGWRGAGDYRTEGQAVASGAR